MSNSTIKLSQYLHDIANELDEAIEYAAGEKLGFTLIVFTPERASYISNCKREESVKEINHLLKCWKEDMPDIKAHEIN